MKENVFKGILTAAMAAVGLYFRELVGPVAVLLGVMVMDYMTGMADAWSAGELSSGVGLRGIVKKLCYLIAVAVAVVVDWIIQTAAGKTGMDLGSFYAFGLLVTIWLILNECISILENLDKLGVPLPGFLRKIIEKLRTETEKEANVMTENELRNKVAGTVMGWVGGVRGGPEHMEVLEIYNSQRPLPRGYRVKTADAYCATTVSAAWLKNGVAAYTGTECSCNELISLAKERGIWVEDDGHVPRVGDAVVYDWQDSGVGDNVGVADHIGIVAVLNGDMMTVAEGNTSGGRIGTREIKVNGRYIRGFICPDYAGIAAELTLAEAPAEASSWAKEAAEKAVAKGIIKGYGNGDFGWRENVTREELVVILDRLGVL